MAGPRGRSARIQHTGGPRSKGVVKTAAVRLPARLAKALVARETYGSGLADLIIDYASARVDGEPFSKVGAPITGTSAVAGIQRRLPSIEAQQWPGRAEPVTQVVDVPSPALSRPCGKRDAGRRSRQRRTRGAAARGRPGNYADRPARFVRTSRSLVGRRNQPPLRLIDKLNTAPKAYTTSLNPGTLGDGDHDAEQSLRHGVACLLHVCSKGRDLAYAVAAKSLMKVGAHGSRTCRARTGSMGCVDGSGERVHHAKAEQNQEPEQACHRKGANDRGAGRDSHEHQAYHGDHSQGGQHQNRTEVAGKSHMAAGKFNSDEDQQAHPTIDEAAKDFVHAPRPIR